MIARDFPSQFRNKNIAMERLIERLKKLNHVPQIPRRHQAPRASKNGVVSQESRGTVKSLRNK